MNLQHTHIKQKNFISGPSEPVEIIVNSPVRFNREIQYQTLVAASGINIKK